MLLRITNKCDMQCSHCFIKTTTKDDKHMDINTLNNVCSYIEEVNPKVLLISGGEPTQHPYFIQVLDRILEATNGRTQIILASNGHFLKDEALKREIYKRPIMVQVSNDSRYYPNRISLDKEDYKNVTYVDRIQKLYPLGKANSIPEDMGDFVGPKCYNVRVLAKKAVSNMKELVYKMEVEMNKFCYLSIDYDGTVRGGESDYCYSLGNVSLGSNAIFRNLKSMKVNDCKACGLIDKMNSLYKLQLL